MDITISMSDGQEQHGGHENELGNASTRMANAITSGDADALRKAASDHAAALGSQATAMAASIAAPVYGRLGDISAAVQELATIVTNARQADLNWRTEERLIRDAQSTRLYVELDKMIANQEDLARRLGKHSSELETIVRRLDNKRAELDLIQREIAELKAWRDAQERGDG
jgi:hypothetical protein